MLNLYEETFGNVTRRMYSGEFGDDVVAHARKIFDEYKSRGIVLNADYDDEVWRISDEKHDTSLMRFKCGDTVLAPWFGCTLAEYREYVKAYIACNLGELAAFTLQDLSRELLRITTMDAREIVARNGYASHIEAFLQLLPGGSAERDRIIEQLAELEPKRRNVGTSSQRVLSDFRSYLHFNDVLSEFWLTATSDERLFYFPLYLWWNLTAILPLRVTEFLLTPRDCLEFRDGRHFITVRRTKLKGSTEKIAYRIADDYELKTYELSEPLAAEISGYIAATRNIVQPELNTLLVTRPHYNYRGINAVDLGRKYFTYFNLKLCMESFRNEVIRVGGRNVGSIRLGDTRHIAMINLIISGGSPTICRELAGHADIETASHYYSNISNLVECATIERLRKANGGTDAAIAGERKYSLTKPQNACRIGNGYCDSEAVRNRDIRDCTEAVNNNGEIGDCLSCLHYTPDEQGLQVSFSDKTAKSAVDADSRYLMQMVEIVRKGLGYQEDIGSAMLRLQHSASIYSLKLQEEFNNGKT